MILHSLNLTERQLSNETIDQSNDESSIVYESMSSATSEDEDIVITNGEDMSPLINDAIDEALEELSDKPLTAPVESLEEDKESRKARLNQIKELLKQKPGFAARTRPAYPLVRRASTATSTSKSEKVSSKLLPKLLSLELFNPETDDLDSDSSGVSSPESAGSVISVISDERFIKKDTTKGSEDGSSGDGTDSSKDMASTSLSSKLEDVSSVEADKSSQKSSNDDSDSLLELSSGSSQSLKLLDAGSLNSSLEESLLQQKNVNKMETLKVRFIHISIVQKRFI